MIPVFVVSMLTISVRDKSSSVQRWNWSRMLKVFSFVMNPFRVCSYLKSCWMNLFTHSNWFTSCFMTPVWKQRWKWETVRNWESMQLEEGEKKSKNQNWKKKNKPIDCWSRTQEPTGSSSNSRIFFTIGSIWNWTSNGSIGYGVLICVGGNGIGVCGTPARE